ncbi:MAG: class I SAM-dependent methyltransferase [Acidimicrobiales bacterium]
MTDFDPEVIAALFGRTAAGYDSVIPFFADFGRSLVDYAGPQPGESVLDVGCGRGATLFPAAERVGPTGMVLGIDLSAEMVWRVTADIRTRGIAQAEVRRADAADLPVEHATFDVVLSSFVLHLLADPDAAAAEMRRAVRPGGRVAASMPLPPVPEWEFVFELFKAYGSRARRMPTVPFRPDFDLAGTLATAGLEPAEVSDVTLDFRLADERAWWDWGWSQGFRGLFEMLEPADLEALRVDAFAELRRRVTPDGIQMRQGARFVLARPPLGGGAHLP